MVPTNGKKTEIYLEGDCKDPRKILKSIDEGGEIVLKYRNKIHS